jgi:hypothetical protein
MLALVVLLGACGDDSPAGTTDAALPETCEHATVYDGPEYDCAAGVCVVSHGSVACRPKCADKSPACTDGLWMTLSDEDGKTVCWCDRP